MLNLFFIFVALPGLREDSDRLRTKIEAYEKLLDEIYPDEKKQENEKL